MPIHVHSVAPLLMVFDMERSLSFYRDLLGFAVVETSGPAPFGWAMLKLGGAMIMLNTLHEEADRPPAPDPARVGAHIDTGLYFGCESADEVHAFLRAKGFVTDEPKTAYYGMRQLYLKDPDGYMICFQHSTR